MSGSMKTAPWAWILGLVLNVMTVSLFLNLVSVTCATNEAAVNCTSELHVTSQNETAISLLLNVSSCCNVTNVTFSLTFKSDENNTSLTTQTLDNPGPVLFTDLVSNRTYTAWAEVWDGEVNISTSDALDVLVSSPSVGPTAGPPVSSTVATQATSINATEAPAVSSTATEAPTVSSTATEAPTVSSTATEAPTVSSTATEAPTVSSTATEAPTVSSTATEAPTVSSTATEAPTIVTESPAVSASTAAAATTTQEPVSPPHACYCSKMGTVIGTQCNTTDGQCDCLPGYTGLNCSTCGVEDTFFMNETVCQQCSKNCSKCSYKPDPHTGQTTLKCNACFDGHGGDLCQDCAPTFYKSSNGACVRCNCSGNEASNGTSVCLDGSGKCSQCEHNTTGDHCELCLAGYGGSALNRTCSKPPAPSLPPVAPSPTKPSKSHKTAIVVGVVCLLVLLIGLVVVLYVRRRKRRRAPFWTIELREDQDTVNFANMMETEYQDLDATTTDNDISMSTRLF